MKKNVIIISLIILLGGFIGFYVFTKSFNNNPERIVQTQSRNANGQRMEMNRNNCLADECLAVDDFDYPAGKLSDQAGAALIEAINDEYKAHALYEKTIAKLGFVRPFSMIVRSEEQHISSLKSLFDKYGLEIPKDDWESKVSAEDTLKQACQAGVDAEIANVKLYKDKLLPMTSGYEDIQAVFNNLMNASHDRHLKAFEKCN